MSAPSTFPLVFVVVAEPDDMRPFFPTVGPPDRQLILAAVQATVRERPLRVIAIMDVEEGKAMMVAHEIARAALGEPIRWARDDPPGRKQ